MTGHSATGAAAAPRNAGSRRPGKRQVSVLALLVAVLAVGLLGATSSATANPSIASKRAQAQAILGQIDQMSREVEQADNALYRANQELAQIDSDLKTNAHHLVVAQSSLDTAQLHVAQRLRSLYVEGSGGSAVEVILGAESLDDLVNRLDLAQRVGAQDAKVIREVKSFRKEVRQHRDALREARTKQAKVVAERAAQKSFIEGKLAEQQRLLASVRTEIQKLQAEEARRQAALAAAARARLAAQQRAQAAARLQQVEAADNSLYTQSETPATSSDSGSSSDPAASIPTPAPSQYGGVVGIALQYLGTPYVWGGAAPGGFDCSGLVQYVYNQVGVSLPHNAAAQYGYGTPVSMSDLQPGDLVFFDGLGHVGIYMGGGQFVHAPHTGDVVKISSLAGWYSSNFVGARRL